jgi:hypothetical protein
MAAPATRHATLYDLWEAAGWERDTGVVCGPPGRAAGAGEAVADAAEEGREVKDYANEWLKQELYRRASEPTVFSDFDPELHVRKVSWYRRLWWKLEAWLPRVHLGPCNHEHCD